MSDDPEPAAKPSIPEPTREPEPAFEQPAAEPPSVDDAPGRSDEF